MFNISCTALTACSTFSNCAIATFVGTTGASRNVTIAQKPLDRRLSLCYDARTFSDNAQSAFCADEELGHVYASG